MTFKTWPLQNFVHLGLVGPREAVRDPAELEPNISKRAETPVGSDIPLTVVPKSKPMIR